MAEELRLRTNHRPSIFNKDMLLGGLLGNIILGIGLNLMVPGIGFLGTAIATTAGAAIGGVVGKNRLERENLVGKKVGRPSFWNKDTAIGGLAGDLIGAIIGGLIVTAAINMALAAAGVPGMTDFTSWAQKIASPAAKEALEAAKGALELGLKRAPQAIAYALGGVGAWLGSIALGTWIGGKHGEHRMEREYEEARRQHIVQHISQNHSPELAQAVEYRMAHDKQWGKQMLEEKLLATAQEPQR